MSQKILTWRFLIYLFYYHRVYVFIRFSVVLYFHTQVSFAYSCPLALQTQAYSYLPLLLIYRLRFSKVRRFFATQLFFVGLVFWYRVVNITRKRVFGIFCLCLVLFKKYLRLLEYFLETVDYELKSCSFVVFVPFRNPSLICLSLCR